MNGRSSAAAGQAPTGPSATGSSPTGSSATGSSAVDGPRNAPTALQPLPWAVWWLGAGVIAVLAATSPAYGFHRDELYFLTAAHHPAFGYPDLPPLTPLVGGALAAVFGESPAGVRVVSTLVGGAVVLLAALTCRELGGGRAEQTLTAAAIATSPVVLGICHLLSTSTLDLLAWTGTVYLAIRAVRRQERRTWLLVGLVLGAGLENKALIVFLAFALVAGVALVGPRMLLRNPWVWAGAAIAVLLWAPNLGWQAAHGFPQLTLSTAIASGGSGSSVSRPLFLPLTALLAGLLGTALVLVGLVSLLRNPALRWVRFVGVAYLVLLAAFLGTGGKPYYTAGLIPALSAAGTPVVVGWARSRGRRVLVGLGVGWGVIGAVVALPIVSAATLHRTPISAINYDAGEQVGWPRFVAAVQTAYAGLPPVDQARAVLLTQNYGEAGALAQARRRGQPLPPVYSGQDGFGLWGPPPDSAAPALVVGFEHPAYLQRFFAVCRVVGRVDNGVHLDNDEQGQAIEICTGQTASWSSQWPSIRYLG